MSLSYWSPVDNFLVNSMVVTPLSSEPPKAEMSSVPPISVSGGWGPNMPVEYVSRIYGVPSSTHPKTMSASSMTFEGSNPMATHPAVLATIPKVMSFPETDQ